MPLKSTDDVALREDALDARLIFANDDDTDSFVRQGGDDVGNYFGRLRRHNIGPFFAQNVLDVHMSDPPPISKRPEPHIEKV